MHTHIIGQHEVPLIPQSEIIPPSVKLKPDVLVLTLIPNHTDLVGVFEDNDSIPLRRLEKHLMTGPIRMPTSKELDIIHVYWLTDAAPWNPLMTQCLYPLAFHMIWRRWIFLILTYTYLIGGGGGSLHLHLMRMLISNKSFVGSDYGTGITNIQG